MIIYNAGPLTSLEYCETSDIDFKVTFPFYKVTSPTTLYCGMDKNVTVGRKTVSLM